jgi:ribosomal protein L34E
VAKPLEQMHQPIVRLKPEDWQVALWDAFPGYISQTEFEANQAHLERRKRRSPSAGRRRDGAALLSGIVLCGRCGRRMHVIYSGRERQQITYICNYRQRRYAQKVCQRVSGRSIDQAVVQAVLEALTPAQIELSLAVAEEMERQQAQLCKQWELRLEGAAYTARLAQRRYELVDPENRLVARHLEREWEARLGEIAQLEADFARQQNQSPLCLSPAQRQQLHNLAQDLPLIWHAETTSWTERKDLLELLIADVTLTRQESDVLVQIRWQTNELDTFCVPLPVRGAPPVPDYVVERVRTLSQIRTDDEIAEILNADDIRTSQGKLFTARRVLGLRRRHKIRKRSLAPDL